MGLPDNPLEPATQSWYDAAGNNRLADAANYDAAGNSTQIAPYTLTYDAENRIVSAASQVNGSTTYTYDGEGRRVLAELSNGTFTLYVNDAMGELAAEYSNAPAPTPGTQYVSVDHLGSTRVTTGTDAGFDVQRFDYLPFGMDLAGIRPVGLGYGFNGPRVRFTGKERDSETGLDFFGARYFSAAQGRWTSPDWSEKPQAVPYANLYNPQSLNLYVYVVNNPLSGFDPDGHIDCTGKNAQGIGCQYIANYNAEHGISPSAKKSGASRGSGETARRIVRSRSQFAYRKNDVAGRRPQPCGRSGEEHGASL
jgi:RHS repeat-associated protein